MRRRAAWAVLGLLAAMPHGAHADAPPAAVQDKIEDFFRPQFLMPDTVDWHYAFSKPYLGGTLWCGKVNYMNSAHIYMGPRSFYATIFSEGVREGAIGGGRSDDPAGAIAEKLHLLCGF